MQIVSRHIMVGVVLGGALCGCQQRGASTVKGAPPRTVSTLPQELIDRIRTSTVLIVNMEGGKPTQSGSGFCCGDSKSIITNRHVVTGLDDATDDCYLTFRSGTPEESVVKVDKDKIYRRYLYSRTSSRYFLDDIAVIKLENEVVPPLTVGRVYTVHETDPVWAFGYPHGYLVRTSKEHELPTPSVHSLTVERIERHDDGSTVIQLGGSPTHGNSGGPVVTNSGEVVGVVEAKEGEDSTSIYALPEEIITSIMRFAKSEMKKRSSEKPYPWEIAASNQQESKSSENPYMNPQKSAGESPATDIMRTHRMTEYDLAGLSARELTLLRNLPFAQHGYRFKRRDLQAVFSSQSWYHAMTSDQDYVHRQLTDNERYNVDFIRKFQNETGKTW